MVIGRCPELMLHSPTCIYLKYSKKQSAHVPGFLWIDTLFTQQKMSEMNWVWALCLHKEKDDITAIMYPWAIILGIFYIICIILCISCLVWIADLIKKKANWNLDQVAILKSGPVFSSGLVHFNFSIHI